MNPPVIVIVCGLAILTVWGVVSPRGQWRALAGWSRRDSYASEPGPVSVAIHRIVAMIAAVALGVAGWAIWRQYESTLPTAPKPLGALQQMWGAPDPLIVNRSISPAGAEPEGLVLQHVLGYQVVDGARRTPNYLFDLTSWKFDRSQVDGGLVGSTPPPGLSALDSASIVVQVRGDRRCIPQAVYADENSTTLTIGVYYGRSGVDNSTPSECNPASSEKNSISVLVPLSLSDPVGNRTVQNVDGSVVKAVPDLAD